jgi:hypothetical protein
MWMNAAEGVNVTLIFPLFMMLIALAMFLLLLHLVDSFNTSTTLHTN